MSIEQWTIFIANRQLNIASLLIAEFSAPIMPSLIFITPMEIIIVHCRFPSSSLFPNPRFLQYRPEDLQNLITVEKKWIIFFSGYDPRISQQFQPVNSLFCLLIRYW